jgi:ornithine cyclodeaminase/alanine dehydrogenase-like protein (mu-crystallin family)
MKESMLYVSREAVEKLGLKMAEIVGVVEAAFKDKGQGKVEMPPKPGIHTRPDAFIHAMPAYIKSSEAAGMKWISGYPQNMERGLPYISGLMILNDPDTGVPVSVMDATWLTAMRTGAATAVAAKYLARPDSKTVAILGCGVQGRSNLQALQVVLKSLGNVHAYDIRDEAASRFCEECRLSRNIECTVCRSPEQAVWSADVVVTAGPILRNPSPKIIPDWLQPGVFVCPLDFDSYVTSAAFHAADLFCTDDINQLRYYQKAGYFADIPAQPVDLGDIVAAGVPRRKSAGDRIISVNLGLALEDVATAQLIYRRAMAEGVGVRLPL